MSNPVLTDCPVPPALARRGIKGVQDNVPANMRVAAPAAAITVLFGDEIRARLAAERGIRPKVRHKTKNTRQLPLPGIDDDLLRRAYRRAHIQHIGMSYEKALETPAVRRCLEIMAAEQC